MACLMNFSNMTPVSNYADAGLDVQSIAEKIKCIYRLRDCEAQEAGILSNRLNFTACKKLAGIKRLENERKR